MSLLRCRLTITESGGIGWLVMLLGCDNPRAREHAEGALVRLSIENANRVLIIKKLVDMLQDSGREAAQEQAAAALANLAKESEHNRKSIVDANGIVPLLELLEHANAKAQENAVGAIKELCRNSKNNQSLIAKAGGIAKLVGVLTGFSANTMKDQTLMQLCTLTASAVKEMAKDNRKNQDAITEAGAIPPLVTMLGASSSEMQANAAGTPDHSGPQCSHAT
jgi:formate dehydrogenase maturation protein FdhE